MEPPDFYELSAGHADKLAPGRRRAEDEKSKQTIKGFFEAFAGRRFCQIDLAFCPWAGCGGAPSERRRDME